MGFEEGRIKNFGRDGVRGDESKEQYDGRSHEGDMGTIYKCLINTLIQWNIV